MERFSPWMSIDFSAIEITKIQLLNVPKEIKQKMQHPKASKFLFYVDLYKVAAVLLT